MSGTVLSARDKKTKKSLLLSSHSTFYVYVYWNVPWGTCVYACVYMCWTGKHTDYAIS